MDTADKNPLHWLFRMALAKKLIKLEQCTKFDTITTLQAWRVLEELGISQQQTLAALLVYYTLEEADFSKIDPSILPMLDNKTSRKYNVVPMYGDDHFLAIATADPFDNETEKSLKFVSSRAIKLFVTTPRKISDYFNSVQDYSIGSLLAKLEDVDGQNPFQAYVLNDDEALPLVIRLVNTIIIRAVAERVSDIHLLYNSAGCRVRFRVDGVLYKAADIPVQIAENVMSRLKVMAGVDVASNLLPCDGRAKLYAGGRLVDLRFNFVPTVDGGKKTTIRIQDSRQRKELAQLGYNETELEQYKRLIAIKLGLILITGPTGSGKTNTLYATLDYIRDDSQNIISIEDPVEFVDNEITQLQVNNKAGFHFSTGLRAAMRQDPDIIMVGEIRDKETAETALQASETGHLVLSTLHTRSAVGAILRLLELGINKSLLASSIAGIVAQRLLRKFCEHCAKTVAIETVNIPLKLKAIMPENPIIRELVGCPHCRQSGYFGRIAIAEVLKFTPEIRLAINEGKPLSEIEHIACSQGMKLLEESAFQHYFAGETTLEEIARVLDINDFNYSKKELEQLAASEIKTEIPKEIRQILLVYSDIKMAKLLKEQLYRHNFIITIITDEKEAALLISQEQLFDLVICELKAVNINASHLIFLLRSNIKYAAIPIIVITASNQDEENRKIIELGANDYITKPISFALLLNRILAVLERTSLS
jgi:type II secretory ATPase GspE/PulE/Tfp pilus assembly ATPase PilB-like protein/ActR/RegA family two-component response regulator